MNKPIWKDWDEFLIGAWEANLGMYNATMRFLSQQGITAEQLLAAGPQEIFAKIGITLRSPKTNAQLHGGVKAFFFQFFPNANELLWQEQKAAALAALRRYRVSEEALRGNPETQKIRKEFSRSRTAARFQLIPGTTSVSVRLARTSASDWNTVKPPCRQRQRRLP